MVTKTVSKAILTADIQSTILDDIRNDKCKYAYKIVLDYIAKYCEEEHNYGEGIRLILPHNGGVAVTEFDAVEYDAGVRYFVNAVYERLDNCSWENPHAI